MDRGTRKILSNPPRVYPFAILDVYNSRRVQGRAKLILTFRVRANHLVFGLVPFFMSKTIGIDLGTSNSCVAVWRENGPEVLLDSKGYNTTPSYVAVNSRGKLIVGHLAKSQVITNPFQTVYAAKRLIGRRYSDEAVKIAKQFISYDIQEGPHGDVQIRLTDRVYSPIEISALILKKLKKVAEQQLKEKVTDAVITVPAYFNDTQRKATKDAGEIAGLNVLRLINEPTAAALAYGYKEDVDKNIAVFDLGGGTFDVTVLSITKGVYEVLATGGDSYLGGEDFDNRLVEYLIKDFKKKSGIDLSSDKMAHQRLKDAAETAKRELSSKESTTISLPFIAPTSETSPHLEVTVQRSVFEGLTRDLIDRCVHICDQVLSESGLKTTDLADILLVGGQTRMPRVRQLIKDFFHLEPSKRVHPDEAVALGASIQAHILASAGKAQGQVPPELDRIVGEKRPEPHPSPAALAAAPEPVEPQEPPVDIEVPAAAAEGEDPFASMETPAAPDAGEELPPLELGAPETREPEPVPIKAPPVAAPVPAPTPAPQAAPAPAAPRGPSGEANVKPFKRVLIDVTPMSLGIATFGDTAYVIIPKNTTVPTRKAKVFTTVKDNQENVRIICTQGESKISSENTFLGEVVLDMPRPNRRGEPQIEVTFHLNTDGILNVTALDKKTNKRKEIRIEAESTLSAEEVKELAAKYEHMDFSGDSEEISSF